MTPKEKAKELIEKYTLNLVTIRTKMDSIPTRIRGMMDWEDAKRLALITVEEVLKVAKFWDCTSAEVVYWTEVKKWLNETE